MEEYDHAMIDSDTIRDKRGKDDAETTFVFVDKLGRVSTANCEVWSCSCPRFSNMRLPCCHLQLAARWHVGYTQLPVEAIPRRWDIIAAQSLGQVEGTIRFLRELQPDITAQRSTPAKRASSTSTNVRYVAVRRRQANDHMYSLSVQSITWSKPTSSHWSTCSSAHRLTRSTIECESWTGQLSA